MSAHNLPFEFSRIDTSGTGVILQIGDTDTGGIVYVISTAAAPAAAAGYQTGCIWQRVGTAALVQNTGNMSSATWSDVVNA